MCDPSHISGSFAFMVAKILITATILCGSLFAESDPPVIAYSKAGVLYFTSSTGRVVMTIRGKMPIGQFAVSPDTSTVVFTPPLPPRTNGGRLYRLDVATGKVRRLTHGHIYDKHEVYADPDISPDDSRVVFAIHAKPIGDSFDAAGPVAVMNLSSGRTEVLQSTRTWDGLTPVFVDHPRWSPDSKTDGSRILMNVQNEVAIVNTDGTRKQELGSLTTVDSNDERATLALGWLGSACVAYVYYDDQEAGALNRAPLYILNLTTREKNRAENLLGIPMTGVREFSWPFYTQVDGNSTTVTGPSGSWTVKDANVAIIPRVAPAAIPASCR
jgi:hypothetical protein